MFDELSDRRDIWKTKTENRWTANEQHKHYIGSVCSSNCNSTKCEEIPFPANCISRQSIQFLSFNFIESRTYVQGHTAYGEPFCLESIANIYTLYYVIIGGIETCHFIFIGNKWFFYFICNLCLSFHVLELLELDCHQIEQRQKKEEEESKNCLAHNIYLLYCTVAAMGISISSL